MSGTEEETLPGRDDVAAYVLWDGSRRRIIDPLEAGAVLEAECPDYVELLDLISTEVPPELAPALAGTPAGAEMNRQKAEAKDKLLAAARKMFGLKPLGEDESGRPVGLGRKGVMDVLMGYFSHMGQLARESRPFGTSQPRDSPSTPPASPAASSAGSGTPGA